VSPIRGFYHPSIGKHDALRWVKYPGRRRRPGVNAGASDDLAIVVCERPKITHSVESLSAGNGPPSEA